MPGSDQVDIELDPFRAGDHVPYEQLKTMRRECPVARIPVGWFLSRQAEVLEAVRQVDTFVASFRAPGVVVPEDEQFINEIVEPRHSRVRKIINASVAYHKAMRLEPFIRDLCDEYLDPLIGRGHGDLVADFVVSIPVNVIAHLIGVPRHDWQRFWHWSDEVVEGTYPTEYRNERGEGLAGAHPEFTELLYGHSCEGMYGAPEYGGNRDGRAWVAIGFDGDVQPRGWTDEEVSNP